MWQKQSKGVFERKRMKVLIKKSKGFKGEILIPGDKSISHRAAFIGSMASGFTEITNFLLAGDCLSTIRCLQKIGVDIRREENNKIIINGKNLYSFSEPKSILDAKNSGTTARFLLGLLSGQSFFSIITGDSSLQKRPMGRVVEPLRKMGSWIEGRNKGNNLPLAIQGQKLKGIKYKIPIHSAQLKSALIISGLLSDGMTELEEPLPTRDHTERMLHFLEADIKKQGGLIRIRGRNRFKGGKIIIPGDISSASYFIAAATLIENSSIHIPNIGINSTRIGFIKTLKKMGGKITVNEKKTICNEPVAALTVSSSNLKGIEIKADEIPALIDEIPLIALLATQAKGKTIIRGASELRVKESDRLKTIVSNFRKMGVEVEEMEDGFIIEGPQQLKGASLQSFGDHRIAMIMAIAGLLAEGKTEIENFSCYKVSFPDFYSILQKWENG